MIHHRLSLAALLLGLCSCATTVPTPSGLPELKVRLPAPEVESRILSEWERLGWSLQVKDDYGFAITRKFDKGEVGDYWAYHRRIRVNLVEEGDGVTQIRVTAKHLFKGVTTETGDGPEGVKIQKSLEKIFAEEAVDGPYVKEK